MSADSLMRRVRRLEILVVVALLAMSGSIAFSVHSARPQVAGIVDARRIRIVDAQGRPRLQIGAPLPDPQVLGKVYPRSRPVPGFMFLDTLGNETGGLALFDDLQGGGLCFDYSTAEAVCLTKAPKLGFVGLTMLDLPPAGASVGKTGSERVLLATTQGTSQLVLSDLAGSPRIRLAVDSAGAAHIEVLDAAGTTVLQLPGRR